MRAGDSPTISAVARSFTGGDALIEDVRAGRVESVEGENGMGLTFERTAGG
jgi:hypothetical protein